jgi:parvulin-like peptidyl-prolyl isomerase
LIDGEPIRIGQMAPLLNEAAGAQVLMDFVLARQVDKALAASRIQLTDVHIKIERQRFTAQLSQDPDQAARLLAALRQRRGLGQARFAMLLRRNAGLRQLVAGRVTVTEPMVRRAFEEVYGPKTVVRMILVPTLRDAQAVLQKLKAGSSFIDLAVLHSTDSSRDAGGLLPAISIADATYPKAVRQVAAKLKPGDRSDPVALPDGFAILRCERKIRSAQVAFEKTAPGLRQQLRLRLESTLMQREARILLDRADVTAFDAALDRAWQKRQKQTPK